jgi:hypothetical protein
MKGFLLHWYIMEAKAGFTTRKTLIGVGGGLFWCRATIASSGMEKHAVLPLLTIWWRDSTIHRTAG